MTKLSASFWFAWRNYYAQIKKFLLPKAAFRIWFIGSIGLNLFNSSSTKAQVTPDNTLGTQVNTADNLSEINGGTKAGSNLFHSFQDFSIETGGTAFFNNGADISNIVGRITGGNISSIDGLIRANGSANLILINPSGINFGANASLDIGGSFLGSTADSLIFEDGTVFSATDAQVEPMLSINVPIGLQLGQNPAPIMVEGRGHNLSLEEPIFSPFTIGESSGLQVRAGETLALVGGDLNLDGGILTAKTGRIELGSVGSGRVNLDSGSQGWRLSYEEVTSFQNITLSQKALADTSGVDSGSIQVQGKQVSLNDGSFVLIQNQGDEGSGNLVVNASESLEINGTTVNGELSSGLFTEALGNGKGGEIEISTQQLSVLDGGVILSNTFGNGEAGQVVIDASESLEIVGFSTVNPSRFSIISSQTLGFGKAGNIDISTQKLTALDGGNIAAVTIGATNTGSGGQVNIDASESVELIGFTPLILTPSQITAGTGSAGNGGNVTINTQKLVIRDGGRVDASTTATGNAGNVNINATESIEVSGTVPNSLNPSLIISSANILDPSLQQLLRLPPVPSGNSGNIQIKTSRLDLNDGALITSGNDGLGNSGSIRIEANSISLTQDSSIRSEIGLMPNTFPGNEGGFSQQPSIDRNFATESSQNIEDIPGGEINISTQTLFVEGGANISTNTFTNFAGGNITINASESIQVQGFSAISPSILSFISTASFGGGNAGNLNLSTGRLTILDGSRVGAGTFGVAFGGNVNVEASSIEVIGAEPSQSVASLLGASSLGAGNAGDLTIDTARLVVRDGGRVDSSAAAIGSAGNVNVQASESIEISGTIPGTVTPSLISSGVNIEDELAQQIFGLPSVPSGNAGSVNIETGALKITDQARVSVVNEGLGNAGTLEVNADSILLDNQGSLSAATQTGVGGNITLQADNVFLQANSTATATAAGAGNGGNISIDADNLAILEDSQLIADAVAGMGGSVEIDTQGFFQCQECQITASSRLGIDGQVNIETLQPLSQLEVVDVFQQPTQAGEDVAIGCPAPGQPNTSKLAVSGRGGLPPRPQEPLLSESLIRFDNLNSQAESPSSTSKNTKLPAPARGWYLNSQGTVVLANRVSGIENNSKIFNNPSCGDRAF